MYCVCVYTCKLSCKGGPDGHAFDQDVFCGDCYMDTYSQVLINCSLLEVLTGLVSTFTLVLILERLLRCWWMMFYKCLWFECRVATIQWRVRGSSPLGHEWGTTEEWRSSKDKRLYLLLTYADLIWAVMLLLLNSREKFFTLIFSVLRFAFLLGREEGVELEKRKPVRYIIVWLE